MSNIEEIENRINKVDSKAYLITEINDQVKKTITSKQKQNLLEKMQEFILSGKFIQANNYIILNMLLDKNKTFTFIKKRGIFHYSKYINSKCIIINLIENLLLNENEFVLVKNEIEYLNSIRNLFPILKILKEINAEINKNVNLFYSFYDGNNFAFIKTILVYVEGFFLKGHEYLPTLGTNNILSYSKEEICEAISYLVYIFTTQHKVTQKESYKINEKYLFSNDINKIILNACYFKKLQEIEILVERFPYVCEVIGNNININCKNHNFDMSMKLGYIRTELQKYYDFDKWRDDFKDVLSIEQIVDHLLSIPNFEVFRYTETNDYPRYIIAIPEPVLDIINKEYLSKNMLFKEEINYVSYIFKEQLINPDSLNNLIIKGDLTLFEFLKIKRFFTFMYSIFRKKIIENTKGHLELLYRSIIPVFTTESIFLYLEKITTKQNVIDYLKTVSWDAENKEYLDLQYHPIIKIKNDYMIPMGILNDSNSIRNLFSSEYKANNPKFFDSGDIDPIAEVLKKVFEDKKYKVFDKISFDFDNKKGDIDFLAFNEEILIFAECKRNLLPTDIFELRTIYDNLTIANIQLNVIFDGLKNSKFVGTLEKKIGKSISSFKNILSVITTSNRIFCGTNYFDHPIRNIHEFANYVDEGSFRTENGNYSLWIGEELKDEDIINYLSENWKLYKLFFESMVYRPKVFNFGKFEVNIENHNLDIELIKTKLKEQNYRSFEIN